MTRYVVFFEVKGYWCRQTFADTAKEYDRFQAFIHQENAGTEFYWIDLAAGEGGSIKCVEGEASGS